MELEEIIAKLRSGDITKEEMAVYLDELGRFASSGKTKSASLTAEEQRALFDEAQSLVKGSTEMQKLQRELIADKRSTRIGKRYAPFFNALMAGADIATSINQVRQSNRGLSQLQRPELPDVPGIDPALDAAIRGAEVGTMDAARAVAPARQAIQDGYQQDLALAKSVGGGQASTTGALGQVAALRRNRAIGSLAPQIDAIRAREQGRLDNLVGDRMKFNNQNYYNRLRQAQIGLNQYNEDVKVAGTLGSVGRLNRRNAVNSLMGAAPGVIARIGNQGYGDRFSDYEMKINQSLMGNRFKESDMIAGNQVPIQTTALNNNNQYSWPY